MNFNVKNMTDNDLINGIKSAISHVIWIQPDAIKLSDSFFSLGGSSLGLISLLGEIQKIFNISIDSRLIFNNNSIEHILKVIKFLLKHPKLLPVNTVTLKSSYRLSFEQYQIFLDHKIQKNKATYNIPWVLEIIGNLNEEKLILALEGIVQNEQLLRASILENSDFPHVIVHENAPFNYKTIKSNEKTIAEDLRNTIRLPFELEQPPLYRFVLFEMKKRRILCCVFHHLVIDLHSLNIFSNLMQQSYNEKTISFSPISYTSYITQQEKSLRTSLSRQTRYWHKIAKLDAQPLIFNKNTLQYTNDEVSSMSFELDKIFIEKSEEFIKRNNFAEFPFFLSIFSLIISRLSIQDNFFIALPISTRTNSNFSNTLGPFINLVIHHFSTAGNDTLTTNVKKLSAELSDLYKNACFPHENIKAIFEKYGKNYNDLLNIAFVIDQDYIPELYNLKTKIISSSYVGHKFDLTFFLNLSSDSSRILIEFDPNKFSKSLIVSIFDAFIYAVNYSIQKENTLFSCIPLIEQKRIEQKTVHYSEKTILDIFKEKVEKYSNETAVEHKSQSISYKDIEKQSNQVANYLIDIGINPGDKIVIKIQPTIQLIICILGILKARAAYVPIDVHSPKERTEYIIDQSTARIAIIDSTMTDFSTKIQLLEVKNLLNNCRSHTDTTNINILATDLAYIIFTSGTTGNPKGVMVNHHNLYSLFLKTNKIFKFDSDDCWILFHSYSFDFSVWEIFGAILHGAKLIIPDENLVKSPEYLYQLIIDKNITVLNQTPSAFSIFCAEAIKHAFIRKLPLKYIIFGGESISNQLILKWFKYYSPKSPQLVNMYGITEGTVHVTYQVLNEETCKNAYHGTLIGKPIDGYEVLLLDNNGHVVPQNFIGEMYIHGACVAQGYVGSQQLTLERFPNLNQFSNTNFYKTGDLAVQLTDKSLLYIGRNDSQVKIRGYRIETGEIEETLMRSKYVDDVAVYVNKYDELDKKIHAFIVPSKKHAKILSEITRIKLESVFHLTELPNKITIADKNTSETMTLYNEIFVENQYLKNGIEVDNNSIVFDVGAHIGLFSIYVSLLYPEISVYAFEPIPDQFGCIEKNQKIYSSNIIAECMGISNITGEKTFNFSDKISSMTSYYLDELEQKELLRTSIDSNDKNSVEAIVLEKSFFKKITSKVTTISEQIKKLNLFKIDLLKIDIEGAELDAINGIKADDWIKISQIVIEVHNIDNRVDFIFKLLTEKGYFVKIEKNINLINSNLFMLYATRKKISNIIPKVVSIKSLMLNESDLLHSLEEIIESHLPSYMRPESFSLLFELPKTKNGKIDYNEIKNLMPKKKENIFPLPNSKNEKNIFLSIAAVWRKVLKNEGSMFNDNFFESGGNSLLAIELANEISKKLYCQVSVVDIFSFPTIKKLSDYIANVISETTNRVMPDPKAEDNKLAIIGINGIFPKANNITEFWDNLRNGKNCTTQFSEINSKFSNLIPVAGVIDNPYNFDADFFKIPPSEAKSLDPQQRLLLEVCYENLLSSGIDLNNTNEKIGVFACVDESTYINLTDYNSLNWQEKRSCQYANSRDFLATRIAYKLGLNGPAITISTACSSALVACAQAANSLLLKECDIAIVCAASLILPEVLPGYFYETDGILSKNGKCSPFDIESSGTVPGSAVTSIILKRYSDAIANNDNIIASICSYSINNDSNDKTGFSAPSVSGQKNCLLKAYDILEGNFDQLAFIETHGTGTKIGDAIEIRALTDALGPKIKNKVYLGSVKANIGHTGAASGLCGLIKTALILNKGIIPPQINFTKWNKLSIEGDSYFKINTENIELRDGSNYAGVSSFGIGGTNVHILLQSEEASSPYMEETFYNIFKNRKKYFIEKNILSNHDSSPRQPIINNASSLNNIKHLDLIKDFLDLIKHELELKKVTLSDNFFEIGGDSLIALSLMTKIHKKYKVEISIDDFYETKTIESLISALLKKDEKNIPKLKLIKEGGENTLILIHPGGGSVYQYEFFKTLETDDMKILAIENQVLNDINSSINSIEKMAECYISLLDKNILENDFTLCGWSFGGNVAYEMEYQLNKKGYSSKEIIMFDSWAMYPDKYKNFITFKNIWFRKLDKSYIFEDELWQKMLWKRLKMLIKYKPRLSNIRIKLFKATIYDPELFIENDNTNFWGNFTCNVNIKPIDATHQNILDVMYEKRLFDKFLTEKQE